MPTFVQDVAKIRQRAIQKIEDGPVTSAYGLDHQESIEILNEALATEIVCVLRYMHHYFMATGVHGHAAANEFKEHADEEREHADRLGERIQQLGGKPNFDPKSLVERSVSQYIEGETLADMIREDLIAERIVIDVYREMIKFFGDKDPTSRILMEDLLEAEEEHASDLADLLFVVNPSTAETTAKDPGTEIGREDDEQRESRAMRSWQGEQARAREAIRQERGQARADADKQAEEARRTIGNIGERQKREGGHPQPTPVPNRRGSSQERQATGKRDVQPAHAPGTTGRVMGRRGRNDLAPAEDDIAMSGQTGTKRSVKVVNKSRKNRAA